jgi:hypothetical protein
MNRREFIGVSALGLAGAGLIIPSFSAEEAEDWDPR